MYITMPNTWTVNPLTNCHDAPSTAHSGGSETVVEKVRFRQISHGRFWDGLYEADCSATGMIFTGSGGWSIKKWCFSPKNMANLPEKAHRVRLSWIVNPTSTCHYWGHSRCCPSSDSHSWCVHITSIALGFAMDISMIYAIHMLFWVDWNQKMSVNQENMLSICHSTSLSLSLTLVISLHPLKHLCKAFTDHRTIGLVSDHPLWF